MKRSKVPKLSPKCTNSSYIPKCPSYRKNVQIPPTFQCGQSYRQHVPISSIIQSAQGIAKTWKFFLHSKVPKVINETHLFLSHSKVFKVSQKRTHFPYRPKCPSCRQNVHIPLIFSLFFFLFLSLSLSVYNFCQKLQDVLPESFKRFWSKASLI